MTAAACEHLLDGLVKTIRAVRDHQSGSAGNHSVIFIEEMRLQEGRGEKHFSGRSKSEPFITIISEMIWKPTALPDAPGVS